MTKQMPPVDLEHALVGTILAERYRIDTPVGQGGFGVVFAGFHLTLEVPVAIKVLHADFATSTRRDRAFERFRQEAKTLAQLRHPNIARVLDTGVMSHEAAADLPWLVMEWCEGPTLTELLAQRTAGSSRTAAWRLFRPIVDAVAYAHEQGIVHRDLKPDNVIIVDGSPRVLDFGIAKVMAQDASASEVEATHSPERAFTPAYGAPEQFAGLKTGPWTDVHALGLILTELLTGERAYRSDGGAELLREALSHRRPTPGATGVDAGPWEAVIARALAQEPSQRHAHGRELLAALDQTSPSLDTVQEDMDAVLAERVAGERERPPAATEHAVPKVPAGDTTLPPESDADLANAPTLTDEPLALPEPPAARSPKPWLTGAAVVGALAIAGGLWAWPRAPQAAAKTRWAPSLEGFATVPPPVATFHPYDDFDVPLLVSRLEARGWRVEIKPTIAQVTSIRLARDGVRGSVVVFRADTAQALDISLSSAVETASHRRGGALLHVYIEGDLPGAEALRDALAETPTPTVDTEPRSVEGSPWQAFEVPAGVDFNDVWADAEGRAVIVGDHGVIVRFDGRAWHRDESGEHADLLAVWGRSLDDVYAVGGDGLILHRSDDWRREPSGTELGVVDVAGHDDRVVAIAGSAVLERIGGRWQATESGAGATLVAVYFEDDDLFVVGHGGAVFRWDAPGHPSHAGWPETGGVPWPLISMEKVDQVNPTLAPWLEQTMELRWTPHAFTVFGPHLMVVGTKGAVFRVAAGVDPHREPTGTEATLRAVCRGDDGTFWAVGEDGAVLRRPP